MCDVYVDLEIAGLQFAHMIINRRDPSDNGFLGDNSVIIPETIYRYDSSDFWQVLSDKNMSSTKTKLMNESHEITIEDQSLGIAQVLYMTDPLQFSTKHGTESYYENFTFSVESANDADQTKDDSGHYNMNVASSKADTNQMMAIKEI